MKHFHQTIEGWFTYDYIYDEAVRRAPQNSSLVEVGSWKGRSAAYMGVAILTSRKNLKLHCVDTWSPDPAPWYREDDDVKAGTLYETFLRNVSPVSQYIVPRRGRSVDVANEFENGSVHFVMIDGTHNYENVKADINAWLPKIVPGGWMAGDDANWGGVIDAVHECLGRSVMEIGRHHWKTRAL